MANAFLQQIYKTKWSNVNDFKVTINPNNKRTSSKDKELYQVWGDMDFYITSVNTPDITQSPIDTFYGNEWALESGRQEIQRITITFRDFDEFTLYRNMRSWLVETKDWYTDEKQLKLSIEQNGVAVYAVDEAYLESVSNISFSRENSSQIGIFSVTFKAKPQFAFDVEAAKKSNTKGGGFSFDIDGLLEGIINDIKAKLPKDLF